MKRRSCADIWPIDEKAGNLPEGFSGWPEKKKFALVLTHDVETAQGHEKCHKLAKLEEELGFRSSFNFVPKRYSVSPELRRQLTSKGFEVGLHGLYHDGKLYNSKAIFQSRAKEINTYIKEWEAKGFRSPSMHNNLEWIHDLNIEYDSSTFDTDPFEPESEGVETIFPFWVSKDSTDNRGYVELPYTLPQDFTVFVLMKEKSIDIWKKKLDWIVKKGGMALITTHPDYMNFGDRSLNVEEYPVEYYMEFLSYVKEQYKDQYWHGLPEDMARFWSKSKNGRNMKKMKKPNILMVVENKFPQDIRVRKEAYTLKKYYDITVIALRGESQMNQEMLDGIHIYRIPELTLPRIISQNGNFISSLYNKVNYIFQYLYITLYPSIIFICTNFKKKYKVIHVHNPPDTLFFIGLIGKLFSTKFVFDHHDLSPELYRTKFSNRKGILYKLLVLCERFSCRLADIIICTNDSYKQIEMDRHGVALDKIYTVRNDPIVDDCQLQNNYKKVEKVNNKIVLLFLGCINPQDGVDLLLKSLYHLVNNLNKKDFICYIVGDGDSLESVKQLAGKLNLSKYIDFKGYVSERDRIKEYLYLSDICVEPATDNYLNEHSTFIKIMEFMAAGRPIVAFDLKETRYSAGEAALFVKPGDIEGFASAIGKLMEDSKLRNNLGDLGYDKIINGLNWEKASLNLLEAYKELSL